MGDQIEVYQSLIDPIYPQNEPNQEIDLGDETVQFQHKDVEYKETANIRMQFLPEDRLHFRVPLNPWSGMNFLVESDGFIKFNLIERGTAIDVFCSAVGGDYNGIVFSPSHSCITVTQPSNDIINVKFHLFNFPDFYGPENYILRTGEPPLFGAKSCGRVVLKADGWFVTIAVTDRTDDLEKGLNTQGGCALTHMGSIVREDGKTFSSEQLNDLLNCLSYFLSFSLGRWASIAFPVGFDRDGKRVFEQWGLPKVAHGRWNGSFSWFDKQHSELLSQVFPGFMLLWKNTLWREPLVHALYWYLGACDRGLGIGVDTGLILAQTALELLAWTHCVQCCKMVSQEAFQRHGLNAANKFRLLASSLDIPKEIPPSLAALFGKPGSKWADSMHAITDIRNSLVHPNTTRNFSHQQYIDAYNLSLWYIDMILLRLCGHNGMYANRLAKGRWVGAVEVVPWG